RRREVSAAWSGTRNSTKSLGRSRVASKSGGAELIGTLRFQWDGGSTVVLIFVVVVAMLSGPSLPSQCRRIEQTHCSQWSKLRDSFLVKMTSPNRTSVQIG